MTTRTTCDGCDRALTIDTQRGETPAVLAIENITVTAGGGGIPDPGHVAHLCWTCGAAVFAFLTKRANRESPP